MFQKSKFQCVLKNYFLRIKYAPSKRSTYFLEVGSDGPLDKPLLFRSKILLCNVVLAF